MGKVLSAILGALFVAFIFTVGGEVEGKLFPVAGETTFGLVEPVGAIHSRIYGDSEKLRDCEFVRLEFRTSGGTVAPVSFEEGTVDRGAGGFGFGPWLVQMTPEQLSNATVTAYHRCHRLWLTQSRWYP